MMKAFYIIFIIFIILGTILLFQKRQENFNEKWNFVDKIIYINLKNRPDRKKEIENELSVIPDKNKIIRFNAIEMQPAHLGCSTSHLKCLELAKREGWKNVLILEDDAMWNNYDKNYSTLETIIKKLNNNYDVISFGNVNANFNKKTYKLKAGQCATAYLVNSSYYDKLINNFKEGIEKLSVTKNMYKASDRLPYEKEYCIDQYWKRLQEKDNWYIINPALMIQRPSKSSISQTFVDYGNKFNL
jgi:glycosyl transferase family 25